MFYYLAIKSQVTVKIFIMTLIHASGFISFTEVSEWAFPQVQKYVKVDSFGYVNSKWTSTIFWYLELSEINFHEI